MPGYLFDTNVLANRIYRPSKISREQKRVIDNEEKAQRKISISAMTLVEFASMGYSSRLPVEQLLLWIDSIGGPSIIPLTSTIARDAIALKQILIDPADCIIVATARVHGLRLLTADQRIIDSNVVSTIS